jgi:putative membrane protein
MSCLVHERQRFIGSNYFGEKAILMDSGFLPARGSFMLDLVTVAMFVVSILLIYSVYLAKSKRNYRGHRAIQITLASVLLIVIIAFEIDIRFLTDWRAQAEKSAYYSSGWVDRVLIIHLSFAIPTLFIWIAIVWLALAKMGADFSNHAHRQFHRRLGWLGTIFMLMTAVTGWIFYWVSFVA